MSVEVSGSVFEASALNFAEVLGGAQTPETGAEKLEPEKERRSRKRGE